MTQYCRANINLKLDLAEYRNQNLDQDQEDRCEIYLENCNLWDAQVGGRSWAERRAAGEGPALDPRTPRHDFQ